MENSFRQNLISSLPTWLAFITTGNGYETGVPPAQVFKGRMPLSKTNNSPLIWYHIGQGRAKQKHNDNSVASMSCDLYIGLQIQAETKEGALTDLSEKGIKNMLAWIYGDTELTANKWFLVDTLTDYIEHTCDDIPVYFDWQNNMAELVFKIEIDYNFN